MKRNYSKISGLLVAYLCCSFFARAQNAHEITVTINKASKTAYQADYKVSKNLMGMTLEDRLKKEGISRGKRSKGYKKYEGVVLQQLSPNKVDIYTRVEGKKDNATIIMLVSSGYDNFISTTSDPVIAANTLAFLNKLEEDAKEMQAAIDLAAQQKALEEAEEKMKASEREKERLAKKKAKLEKKLEAEKLNQEKASKQRDMEKLRLDNMQSQEGQGK